MFNNFRAWFHFRLYWIEFRLKTFNLIHSIKDKPEKKPGNKYYNSTVKPLLANNIKLMFHYPKGIVSNYCYNNMFMLYLMNVFIYLFVLLAWAWSLLANNFLHNEQENNNNTVVHESNKTIESPNIAKEVRNCVSNKLI